MNPTRLQKDRKLLNLALLISQMEEVIDDIY
jgi:hypothetical protein